MATRTTAANQSRKKAPAKGAEDKSLKSSRSKTGSAARSKASAPAESPDLKSAETEETETAAPVKIKAETVSLIDEPAPRGTSAPRARGRALPVISKIRATADADREAAAETTKNEEARVPAAPPKAEALDLIGPKKNFRAAAKEELPVAQKEIQPDAQTAPTSIEDEADPADDSSDKVIHIKPPIIVKDLASQLGLKPFQLIHELMEMNIFAAINHTLEPEVATKICANHGFVFEVERREKGAGVHKVEVVVQPPPPPVEQKDEELKSRAPVITFMGHVDHGKTSLMDAIRKARVAAGEAGGITQHIGAYSVERNGQQITFLDTPGHAAFTAMRARGANVTDIVVLVVAADDGIMPQTLEALNHAKAANVSIIVAINKIDLPSANLDRVKGQLQEHGLTPEDWGGETICCPVSATKGDGLEQLLEMMLLQAEIMELKASDDVDARGRVIEAQIEAGRGPTATIIVQTGTLKVGDAFICGDYSGKVKSLLDDQGKPIKSAGPSTPVKVLGFSGLPFAGDELLVMESERKAKLLSDERHEEKRSKKLAAPARATLETLFASMGDGAKKNLRLIVKSDVQGSLEAILGSIDQIDRKKVELELVHAAVGPISESDVLLASASNAVIIGFNVKVENVSLTTAKREGVQIKLFSIIYELIDQIKEAMTGLLDMLTRENVIGHAEVKQIFPIHKGAVAGSIMLDGRALRSARARVTRRKQAVFDGPVNTLRRFQDEVKEVRAGLECGIRLGEYNDYEVGDVIEFYTLEKVAQAL